MKTVKKALVIVLSLVLCFGTLAGCATKTADGKSTLLLGVTEFNGVFNFLTYNSAYDRYVTMLTQLNVYNTGKGGDCVDGACTYQEPEIKTDENGNQYTVYTFKIKDGLKFSDGQPVTADDLIWTYKAQLAPAYDGLGSLYTYKIRGANEYRYDDPNYADAIVKIKEESKATPEQIKEAAKDMATSDYEDESYGPEGLIEDLKLNIDGSLEAGSDAYKEAVITAATDAYATDYADEFIPDIEADNEAKLTTEYVSDKMAGGENVPDVSGIVKLDDLTVQVTADGVDPTLEVQLGQMPIMPKHYYGEKATKVDFSDIKKKNGAPLGGGPYIFDKFENNIVTLHANPDYYEGKPQIETIKFQVIPVPDQLSAATNGDVNIMLDLSCTPDNVQALEDAGKYAETYDRNGWGYVGISGKLLPDANVRKGLASLMDRASGVNTYYGKLAKVLERPITMASWGYPYDDNAPVYAYDTAKALDYFKAAGYTQTNGKLVDKNGKILHIDAYISSTEHPVVPLFTQMKNDIEALGGEFSVTQIDWASFSEQYKHGDLMLWAAAYGDGPADPDCYQYFHSDSIASGNNPFYTNDPEVDKLIMEGRETADRDDRLKIYAQLFDKIMDTATVMPYYQRLEMNAIDPTVVDISSIPDDLDSFHILLDVIQNIKLVEKQ
ncbi:hypothetical protein FACS1894111_07270 [Clostridia bacterium]|nr:hypothetical protein FACS1894111_07270 [Clostridia bacterium]